MDLMEAAGIKPVINEVPPKLGNALIEEAGAILRSGLSIGEWKNLEAVERRAFVVAAERLWAERLACLATALADPETTKNAAGTVSRLWASIDPQLARQSAISQAMSGPSEPIATVADVPAPAPTPSIPINVAAART